MRPTWIVAASRVQARVLQTGPTQEAFRVATLDNPKGRLRDSEIDADRPGTATEGVGHAPHAKSREESATERTASDFARRISHFLEQSLAEQRFAHVVLVAEPKMLGLLRGCMRGELAKSVSLELHAELNSRSDTEIVARVRKQAFH